MIVYLLSCLIDEGRLLTSDCLQEGRWHLIVVDALSHSLELGRLRVRFVLVFCLACHMSSITSVSRERRDRGRERGREKERGGERGGRERVREERARARSEGTTANLLCEHMIGHVRSSFDGACGNLFLLLHRPLKLLILTKNEVRQG